MEEIFYFMRRVCRGSDNLMVLCLEAFNALVIEMLVSVTFLAWLVLVHSKFVSDVEFGETGDLFEDKEEEFGESIF